MHSRIEFLLLPLAFLYIVAAFNNIRADVVKSSSEYPTDCVYKTATSMQNSKKSVIARREQRYTLAPCLPCSGILRLIRFWQELNIKVVNQITAKTNIISLIWIPGHRQIEGYCTLNELVPCIFFSPKDILVCLFLLASYYSKYLLISRLNYT